MGQVKTQEKRWIVDIDTKENGIENLISNEIYMLRPEGPKVEMVIPTKNGYHLITSKFDVKTFKEKFPEMDIQKKNPTLLYYPESLG